MSRRRGPVVATTVVITLLAAACSGSDAPSSEAESSTTPAVESTAVMPPVSSVSPTTAATDLTTAPAETTTAPAETTTTTAAPGTTTTVPEFVELGVWDWGAPCRVPVTQHIGPDAIGPDRTFDIVVSGTDTGYRLDFENLETDLGTFGKEEVAEYLLQAVAALPPVLLGADGRFVGFEDLAGALLDLAAQGDGTTGGDELTDEEVAILTPLIVGRTIDPWFGLWLDRGVLEPSASAEVEERELYGALYQAEVTISAARLVDGSEVAEFGEGTARFFYDELGERLSYLDESDRIALDIDAEAVIDLERVRPIESVVWITFWDGTNGLERNESSEVIARHVFETTFDWDNAEGCE